MIEEKEKQLAAKKEMRKRRREIFLIALIVAIIFFLSYLQSRFFRFADNSPYINNLSYFGIIYVIIILILILAFLVIRNLVKLFFERKRKRIGSKLRTKLSLAFVLLSLIPTLLLFFASVNILKTSIESWFSVQVETSLRESYNIAETYYENIKSKAKHDANVLSSYISKLNSPPHPHPLPKGRGMGEREIDNFSTDLLSFLKQKQLELSFDAVELILKENAVIKLQKDGFSAEGFTKEDSEIVKNGFLGNEDSMIEEAAGRELVKGYSPVYFSEAGSVVDGVLVVTYRIPENLIAKVRSLQKAYEDYKNVKQLKDPIKTGHILILLIITLLIMFFATWFGIHLAKNITVPIQQLAEGTEKVAKGELDFQIEVTSDDEIARLVELFNKMTFDLKDSKVQIDKANDNLNIKNIELEQRKRYGDIVLSNIATGVISFDNLDRISTINKSAENILQLHSEDALNKSINDENIPPQFVKFKEIITEMYERKLDSFERELSMTINNKEVTLLTNITILNDENNNYVGLVMVLDDLTELVKAQRVAAWREVARRIAHEIKNPLTPIQLSAQRLKRKYKNVIKEDADVFEECTTTIINQVEEMKNLVNEFSNFARMPAANPTLNNLNELIEEVLSLYKNSIKNAALEFLPEADLPLIKVDKEQIKRVIINLLENSIASFTTNSSDNKITIETYSDKTIQMAVIEVADTGRGIPAEIESKLFEPYFSTKKSGTGLGLAIVKTIVTDHHGYVRIRKNLPKGTCVVVELPLVEV